MDALVNQYSFLLAAAAVFGIAWLVVRNRSRWLRRITALATLALLAALIVTLRPGTGDIERAEDLDHALARGQPVALEFFSNW